MNDGWGPMNDERRQDGVGAQKTTRPGGAGGSKYWMLETTQLRNERSRGKTCNKNYSCRCL